MLEKPPTNRQYNTLISKASSIAIVIVFLALLGHWLDIKFHSSAIFTIVGVVLGFLYSLYEVWFLLKNKD